MPAAYINIHSHHEIVSPHLGIQNFHAHELLKQNHFPSSYSIGLHPWFIKHEDHNVILSQMRNIINNPDIKAIGECGLDRAISVDIELQKEIMIAQLEMADQHGKALIVHNVRAFSDMLAILKKYRPSIPILFHAYSGNKDIMQRLMQFNVYFSFGHALFNEESKASRVLTDIPLNRLFFETDDWDGDIEEIYSIASQRIGRSIIELRNQIYYTYKSLFL